MNKIDLHYQSLLQDILDNGVTKEDRTGTGTLSVFGRQIRHKMSEGFPLLTTKKIHWSSIVTELLWFLRGDTNIKFLLDYNCNIWNGDAYKNYQKSFKEYWQGKGYDIPTMETFIDRMKNLEGFAENHGELGPIYGKQWRSWERKTTRDEKIVNPEVYNVYIDQIQNLINDLKTNPDSRRLMVSAWNVGDLDKMVLPPCHYGFQVYTRELSWKERWEHYLSKTENEDCLSEKQLDSIRYPKRAISLMWNQRSVDTFLGLPFNIASYGLLLEIIAKEVNMIADELIGNLGDVHLYSNHIEQAKEQIGRELTLEERMHWWFENKKPNRDICDHIDEQSDYAKEIYFDSVDVPKRTRQPFKLPKLQITERNWYQHEKVKEHLGEKTFNEKILSYRPDCFELIGYESHSKIKAPLSN